MHLESLFERLAPELLLHILTHLPDLESLDNLLRASPAASRLFDVYGVEIFEGVLSSSVPYGHTCALIRIVALVRSSSLPPLACDLISFRNFVRHESTSHRYNPPLWTLPSPILSDVSVTVLRGLLATHRKIVCLTISCLKFYLNRFKPLRPSHLVDTKFHFESDYYGPDGHYVPSWQQTPAERPFPVHDIGPPTWVEEQRVLRAFWRVQLFRELKTAINASVVNWPENDVRKLNDMAEVGLYDVPLPNLLDEVGEPFLYQQNTLLEHELIWSVVNYTKDDRQTITAPAFLQTRRDWSNPTAKGQQDWNTISDYLLWTHIFFHEVTGGAGGHVVSGLCSPLQHVSFEPFRRLGFVIWDTERMVGYGLLDPEYGFKDDSYLLAWKSILGKDDIAEVERINQRRYIWATQSESDKGDSDESEWIQW